VLFTGLVVVVTYNVHEPVWCTCCLKDKKERRYRNGEVSYADREYKFAS